MNKPLLILGARTFSVQIADLVSEIPDFELVGFVENMDRERCEQTLEGLPVLWVEDIAKLAKTHWVVCALGSVKRDCFIQQVARYDFKFATIIHPLAKVSSRSSLGMGSILDMGVMIGARAQIRSHVIICRGGLIGHHTVIGDYSTVALGANIAGNCLIGESAFIGMSAVVLDHIKIGAHSIVGAGSVVTKDVPDHVQVLGVPAKIVEENIAGDKTKISFS